MKGNWLQESRVVLCFGAGGVGKTTTSTLLALRAASAGKRVALLSIDPAKRLAAAMGIELGSELRPVNIPGVQGSLHAAMLDQKAVFDDMVRRFSPKPTVAEKITRNKLYQAAASNLGGALEYMALAKLQQLARDPNYDLVVVDTPPDTHALDFLERPNILANFFDHKVMGWLIKPFHLAQRLGLGRVMSAGEKLMGGLAAVTGVKALQQFAEFLVLMQEVLLGFNQAGQEILEILQERTTAFVVVTTPRSAAVRSALHLMDELSKRGYWLHAVILNRCIPSEVLNSLEACRTEKWSAPLAAAAEAQRQAFQSLHGELMQDYNQEVDLISLEDSGKPIEDLTGLLHLSSNLG